LKRKHWLTIVLIAFGVWFIDSGVSVPVGAQPLTHTVEKGDTLWDICEKYYGNEELWPKLWQMNPFITNPHLLRPGDVITLLDDVPLKKAATIESVAAPPKKTTAKFAYGKTGIDVSGFTNVASIGFLSTKPVEPWGSVLAGEGEKVVLSEGDTIFVSMKDGRDIKQGDQFTIFNTSPLIEHPLSGEEIGYVISFLGRLAIKDKIKEIKEENEKKKGMDQKQYLYKAEIVESYRAVPVGSKIISYEPISPCIEPMPKDSEFTTKIIAVKDLHQIIGQFTVVYLAHGYNHGVRKGNLFEVIEKKQIESPQKTTLPGVIMGYVIILEARPDTATGVVVASQEEFSNGAFVNRIDWPNAQIVLSLVPDCPLE
jgi:hypothetical protein